MVDAIKKETGLDIFLNADHVHSLASAEEALAAGFDSVTFDRGELPLEQNIAETKAVVDLARQQYPGVLIEGELGFIGHSSEIIAEVPTGAAVAGDDLTTVADAVRFATETGIDLLAPAVGNIHGIVTAGEPQLDLTRLAEISQATGLPLVLHGGSGNTEADLAGAVAAGATIVHINTEMRRAWRAGLEAGLVASPTELAPYKLSSQAVEQMQAVIMAKIKLFRCA
jgi:fructose-bisphosphate aldolase class II